jgi:hypothetical protein
LVAGTTLPLLVNVRRAVDLAALFVAAIRADDVFCADVLVAARDLAAAREAGFFILLLLLLAMLLSLIW